MKFATTGLRSATAKTDDLQLINELIETGKIKPVVDRCYSLAQMAEAHRYAETGQKKGNIVIMVANHYAI